MRKIPRLPGFDPRAVQPVASRYTDYSLPADFLIYTEQKFTSEADDEVLWSCVPVYAVVDFFLSFFLFWLDLYCLLVVGVEGYCCTPLGRTSLDEGSVRRRGLYLHGTQHSQETNIHAPGGKMWFLVIHFFLYR